MNTLSINIKGDEDIEGGNIGSLLNGIIKDSNKNQEESNEDVLDIKSLRQLKKVIDNSKDIFTNYLTDLGYDITEDDKNEGLYNSIILYLSTKLDNNINEQLRLLHILETKKSINKVLDRQNNDNKLLKKKEEQGDDGEDMSINLYEYLSNGLLEKSITLNQTKSIFESINKSGGNVDIEKVLKLLNEVEIDIVIQLLNEVEIDDVIQLLTKVCIYNVRILLTKLEIDDLIVLLNSVGVHIVVELFIKLKVDDVIKLLRKIKAIYMKNIIQLLNEVEIDIVIQLLNNYDVLIISSNIDYIIKHGRLPLYIFKKDNKLGQFLINFKLN